MKRAMLLVAAVALAAPNVAPAQSKTGEAIGSAIGLIGGIVANNKLQRDIASMSAPLEYESDLPALDPASPRDPRNFDIAGVRFGMTPEQVVRTLRTSRYTLTDKVMNHSFDSEVRNRVNMGKPTPSRYIEVPYYLTFTGPDRQEIKVGYIALPDGPVVKAISYSMTSDAMSQDAFAAQVQGKYGEPVEGDGEVLLWCVGPGEPCEGRWIERPHMKVDVHAKTIDLRNEDAGRDTALQARIEAEVAARKRTVESARF